MAGPTQGARRRRRRRARRSWPGPHGQRDPAPSAGGAAWCTAQPQACAVARRDRAPGGRALRARPRQHPTRCCCRCPPKNERSVGRAPAAGRRQLPWRLRPVARTARRGGGRAAAGLGGRSSRRSPAPRRSTSRLAGGSAGGRRGWAFRSPSPAVGPRQASRDFRSAGPHLVQVDPPELARKGGDLDSRGVHLLDLTSWALGCVVRIRRVAMTQVVSGTVWGHRCGFSSSCCWLPFPRN